MFNQTNSVSTKILLGLFLSSLSVIPVNGEPLINPDQQLGRVCALIVSKEAVIKLPDGTIFHQNVSNASAGDTILINPENEVELSQPHWLGILIENYGYNLRDRNLLEEWKQTSC